MWPDIVNGQGPNAVQRVARNSAAPILAQLLNKSVDLAFVPIVLRVLGTAGNGAYEYAILVWLYTKTFTDFGLAVLATRDVARRPELAGEYVGLTTILRLVLWLAALPAVALFALVNWRWLGRTGDSTVAVLLLLLSIVPDSYSDAANAICNARERMAAPAALTLVKNTLKVGIGLLFLLNGWGVIGLALTALITNVVTAGFFRVLLRRLDVRAVWRRPGPEARLMLREAWPLLINNLLAGLFFRVDIFVLGAAKGDEEVGVYAAPYKFLNLLLLVPQYGILALFPHLSRLAAERAEALAATYALAVKLLLVLALPICVATTFVAPDLMRLLGGRDFLPDAGIALRLLIWFLPFSYVNGLTQYVLIAAGHQRVITRAFALTAAFNIGANLLLTPPFGYPAAALITVASEFVLLFPFLWVMRTRVGPLPGAAVFLRPLLGAAVMGAAGWAVLAGLGGAWALAPWLAAALGGGGYLLTLLATGGIGPTEHRLVLRLLGRGG